MVIDDEPVVAMRIPLIEEWNFTFSYKYKALGFIPCSGDIKLSFKDVGAEATVQLKATQHGYLYPQLHDITLDFGESELYEENKWWQFWHRQWFDMGKYIL